MIGSSDMTHYMGGKCPLREDCFRYWLHKNSKVIIASYFAAEAYDKETNKCKHYLNKKDWL